MREAYIEKKLKQGVETLGGRYEHKEVPGTVGHPDGEVTWPRGHDNALDDGLGGSYPRVEFVEVKTLNGKFEPGQERDHAKRRADGFEVHVLRGMKEVE